MAGSSRRPKRVLVTGGAGFIGSHVADRYLAEGCEVTVVDDLSTGRLERVPEGAGFVEMELVDPDLADVVHDGRFDTVNHHAAQIDVRASVRDPLLDVRSNVQGLLHLVECARHADVERFVYVSSGGVVYGEPAEIPTPETHPLLPRSPYGVSKLAGEQYLAVPLRSRLAVEVDGHSRPSGERTVAQDGSRAEAEDQLPVRAEHRVVFRLDRRWR